ncbi:MAG TPA: ankyrin repeat domain-containing protein [Candidatus Kapabacteria bacterium]|nr:ankyrin repeat domain-containing protein [Candidatus Kapabacteria bacterium]
MEALLTAILDDDRQQAKKLLKEYAELARRQIETARFYDRQIFHWIYVGDTALHLAAAGYRVELIQLLLNSGADANSNSNHRRSGPLHYATDGYIAVPTWDPKRQVETIRCLLEAGADIDAQDKNGATPLHRAVRTRSAAAVKFLLEAGCDAKVRNKPGSTAFHLAVQNTGRGGSGAEKAKEAQREIIQIFIERGLSPQVQDSRGKTVFDWARSGWVKEMLIND